MNSEKNLACCITLSDFLIVDLMLCNQVKRLNSSDRVMCSFGCIFSREAKIAFNYN